MTYIQPPSWCLRFSCKDYTWGKHVQQGRNEMSTRHEPGVPVVYFGFSTCHQVYAPWLGLQYVLGPLICRIPFRKTIGIPWARWMLVQSDCEIASYWDDRSVHSSNLLIMNGSNKISRLCGVMTIHANSSRTRSDLVFVKSTTPTSNSFLWFHERGPLDYALKYCLYGCLYGRR